MSSRYGVLDGLRGIAVLIVFVSHTSGRDQFLPFLNFHGTGHVGVYLFFVLSAFLLGNNLFKTDLAWQSVKEFYIKRALRILPLYYLVLIGTFLVQHNFGINTYSLYIKHGFTGFIQHLYLYRGDSLFWSVVAELHFYLIVPVLIFLIVKFRWIAIIWLLGIAGINALLYTSKHIHWPFQLDWIKYLSLNDRDSGSYIDIFICGIVVAFLWRFHREKLNTKYLAISGTIAFWLMLISTMLLIGKDYRFYYDYRYLSIVFAVGFSVVVLSLMNGNRFLGFLNSKWLRQIGVVGFSFYLLHFPCIQLVNYFDLIPAVKLPVSFALTFGASWLSFYLIEQPSISLAKRLIKKPEESPAFK